MTVTRLLPRSFMQNQEFDHPKELLRILLSTDGLTFCEYRSAEDLLILYDHTLQVKRTVPDYMAYLDASPALDEDEHWRLKEFYRGNTRGEIEVRVRKDNEVKKKVSGVSGQRGRSLCAFFVHGPRCDMEKK